MRFIVDAQLPKSLSDFLNYKGCSSVHTSELPDQNRTKDTFISKLANDENRIVISKDVDFLESFLIKSEPQTHNCKNRKYLQQTTIEDL